MVGRKVPSEGWEFRSLMEEMKKKSIFLSQIAETIIFLFATSLKVTF